MRISINSNLIINYKPTYILKFLIAIFIFFHCNLQAQQQAYSSEGDMRDIFITGGYGALFGATMGTAILPFLSGSPINNIRVVAGGASIGFMMGSAFGLYNVSKTQSNSYFNYTPENEENYYYSMPSIVPGQGSIPQKKENLTRKRELPKAGALIVGEEGNIGFAIPAFWIGQNQFGLVIASLKF